MKRPIIGITTIETNTASPNVPVRPVTLVNQAYVDLALSFNAAPLLLTYRTPLDAVPQIAALLDGLIIIGGQDIDPQIFKQTPKVQYRADLLGSGKPFLRPIDYQPSLTRDTFEITLYHECKTKKIPIFGICRGLQIINVAEGGTLHQEIPEPKIIEHERGDDGFIHHHHVEIDKNSYVYSLMQTQNYVMASLHHQCIETLGQNLHKAAWSEDGVIEIIERVDENHFIVGVHGHIEQTRKNLKLYDNILRAFMERAGRPHEVSPSLPSSSNLTRGSFQKV